MYMHTRMSNIIYTVLHCTSFEQTTEASTTNKQAFTCCPLSSLVGKIKMDFLRCKGFILFESMCDEHVLSGASNFASFGSSFMFFELSKRSLFWSSARVISFCNNFWQQCVFDKFECKVAWNLNYLVSILANDFSQSFQFLLKQNQAMPSIINVLIVKSSGQCHFIHFRIL